MGPNQGVDFAGIMDAIKVADRDGDVRALTALSGMLRALAKAAAKAGARHMTPAEVSQSRIPFGLLGTTVPPTTGGTMQERWLTAKQAAVVTGWVEGQGGGMNPRWWYENQHRLPFGKKVGRSLRFLESGVRRLMRDGL